MAKIGKVSKIGIIGKSLKKFGNSRSNSHSQSGGNLTIPTNSSFNQNPLIWILLFIGLIVLILSVFVLGRFSVMPSEKQSHSSTSQNTQSSQGIQEGQQQIIIKAPLNGGSGSEALFENPSYYQKPPSRPFYFPTRGEPAPFAIVGVLIGEEKKQDGEPRMLPLYGKQIFPGSNKYHYYCSTDQYNPVKISVFREGRDCLSTHGCGELYQNDSIKVSGYSNDFKVEIYPTEFSGYIG
jgi:hypothetical protein